MRPRSAGASRLNGFSNHSVPDQIAGAGIEPADSSFKATDFYQQKLPRMKVILLERVGWDSNPRASA